MYKGIAFDAYGTLLDVYSVAQKCEIELISLTEYARGVYEMVFTVTAS